MQATATTPASAVAEGTAFHQDMVSHNAVAEDYADVEGAGYEGEATTAYDTTAYDQSGYWNSSTGAENSYDATAVQAVEAAVTTDSVVSQLSASFEWTIDDFLALTEDKLISQPFGGLDWRWQMVLYPKGAGGAHSHLSCFLRPLRNLEELSAGNAWSRPILNFNIKVMKGTASSGSYADNFAYMPSAVDNGTPKEVLVEDTSASSFTGFHSALPAWGFTDLLELTRINEAVSPNGSITISATVSADISTQWTTCSYPWTIPTFDMNALVGDYYSPVFGNSDMQWCMVMARSGDDISLHLQPVLSDDERYLESAWKRSISSLKLKIRSAEQLEGSYEDLKAVSYAVVKSITGGFTFTPEAMTSGWPKFIDVNKFSSIMEASGSITVEAEVTMDLESLEKEWNKGTRAFLISKCKEVVSLGQQIWEERRVSGEESERQKGIAKELRRELEVAKVAEMRLLTLESALLTARAGIAGVVARMAEVNGEGVGYEDAMSRARTYAAKAENARGLLDHTSSLEARAAHRRSMVSPVGESESISISQAISNLRHEMSSARIALDDVYRKDLSGVDARATADRAAVRADLAMVVAELEVARAAFSESLATSGPPNGGFEDVDVTNLKHEVMSVIGELERIRATILYDESDPAVGQAPLLSASSSAPTIQVDVGAQGQFLGVAFDEKAVVEKPVARPALSALQIPAPATRRMVEAVKPEPWTPVEGHSDGVDAVLLEKILKKLDRMPANRRGSGFFSWLLTLLFTLFTVFLGYSAIHVHCTGEDASSLCTTVVPAYSVISTSVHLAAESFVKDFVPKAFSYGEGFVADSMKAGQDAADKLQRGLKKAVRKPKYVTMTVTDVKVSTVVNEVVSTAVVTTTAVATSVVTERVTATATVKSVPTGFVVPPVPTLKELTLSEPVVEPTKLSMPAEDVEMDAREVPDVTAIPEVEVPAVTVAHELEEPSVTAAESEVPSVTAVPEPEVSSETAFPEPEYVTENAVPELVEEPEVDATHVPEEVVAAENAVEPVTVFEEPAVAVAPPSLNVPPPVPPVVQFSSEPEGSEAEHVVNEAAERQVVAEPVVERSEVEASPVVAAEPVVVESEALEREVVVEKVETRDLPGSDASREGDGVVPVDAVVEEKVEEAGSGWADVFDELVAREKVADVVREVREGEAVGGGVEGVVGVEDGTVLLLKLAQRNVNKMKFGAILALIAGAGAVLGAAIPVERRGGSGLLPDDPVVKDSEQVVDKLIKFHRRGDIVDHQPDVVKNSGLKARSPGPAQYVASEPGPEAVFNKRGGPGFASDPSPPVDNGSGEVVLDRRGAGVTGPANVKDY
ncbi:hypothetical protein HDU97_004708 [Phlyctochytrium planicorne]|nr:hypothetical protein HDU97_004708 [Phlyctochytrium planicorne]